MGRCSTAVPRQCLSLVSFASLLLLGGYGLASLPLPANAAETLTLSCSAQVYEAFRGEFLEDFQKRTGVTVSVDVVTSWAAVSLLSNGASDMAATAEGLQHRFKAEGMQEFPFCRDALVVITHIQNRVRDLSEDQVRGVFSGAIGNWEELGGPNQPIRVITPAKDTAAYKMFSGMVMKGVDIAYYLSSAQSTVAANATRRYTGAVSFVNQGALHGRSVAANVVRIDGLGPGDPEYPYYEVFSLVTRGSPGGSVKAFVDYAFSDEARRVLTARGMKPIAR